MPTEWLLATQGDPLGAVRRLVAGLWRRAGLEGFLVPAADDADDDAPRLLADAGELQTVNPFRPLMRSSTARFVPELTRARPAARLGVLARPCEMRALVEMAGRAGFGLDRLVTVSVDCLSTLPPGDYARLAASRVGGADLGDESVRFARQGGISPYRFRAACQMCATPAARDGDVNVGVLGMPVREWLLVAARDPATGARLDVAVLSDGPATEELTGVRASVVAHLVERRARARERIERGIERMPEDSSGVAERLARCAPVCHACLDACPICAVEPLERGPDGTWAPDDVARWLASCTCCGMCEQECPADYPLAAMFGHVHDRLAEGTGLTRGS